MEAQRNLEAKIIKPKLGLLELSHQLGRVTQACKVFGYSRDSFYRFKSFMRMEANLHFAISSTQKRKQNRLKRMESARDFIKQFSRNSIKLLFGKSLDEWLREYNESRPHSGKYCYGKTPMQTFLDSQPLAKEKRLQYSSNIPS